MAHDGSRVVRLLDHQQHWRSLWPPPLFVHLAELEERYHPSRNRSPSRGGASAEADAEGREAALQAAHSREYALRCAQINTAAPHSCTWRTSGTTL